MLVTLAGSVIEESPEFTNAIRTMVVTLLGISMEVRCEHGEEMGKKSGVVGVAYLKARFPWGCTHQPLKWLATLVKPLWGFVARFLITSEVQLYLKSFLVISFRKGV